MNKTIERINYLYLMNSFLPCICSAESSNYPKTQVFNLSIILLQYLNVFIHSKKQLVRYYITNN